MVSILVAAPDKARAASILPGEALCGENCPATGVGADITEDPRDSDDPVLPPPSAIDTGDGFLGDILPDSSGADEPAPARPAPR